MRSLFPKKVSVQDIEREVTEQLETMVRSGKNPPPASWTLLGGLHGNEQRAAAEPTPVADEPAPVAESAVDDELVSDADAPIEAAPPAEEPEESTRATRSPRGKAGSSRARSTGAKSSGSRTTGGARPRRSTTASARRSTS
jgi:hypothetical protein